jgi:Immunity protein Imm1
MQLTINHEVYEVSEQQEVKQLLSDVSSSFVEVWLNNADGWPTLCALINANSAWLMYLRFEGDSGFSTRNPAYRSSSAAVIEYRLANGQRDEYPASWDVSTAEALRALEYFLIEEKMAPWLEWHQA